MNDELRLRDPDTVYEALLDAHLGLTPEESETLTSALVLLLANQVGDDEDVLGCIRAAREDLGRLHGQPIETKKETTRC